MRSPSAVDVGITRKPAVIGLSLTVAMIVLAEALLRVDVVPSGIVGALLIPPLIAVIVTAFLTGLGPGLIAAALVSVYGLWFYATVGRMQGLEPVEVVLPAAVIAVTAFFVTGLMGALRTRADRATARAVAQERAYQADLERTNARLEALNRALKESNETLESFSYVVAHDLKEPVRAVEALSTALVEDYGDDLPRDALTLVGNLRKATARLSSLVTGLLEVSRAARVDTSQLGRVTVRDALADETCASRYAELARERQAVVDVTGTAGAPPVLATTQALCQVLGNLVLNAIRHNPRHAPTVRVRARAPAAEPGFVEIVVEDDGPGFTDRARRQLEAEAGGSGPGPRLGEGGFGLVIVQRTLARLRGRLSVGTSTDLGGAAVRVLLPTADGADELEALRGRGRDA